MASEDEAGGHGARTATSTTSAMLEGLDKKVPFFLKACGNQTFRLQPLYKVQSFGKVTAKDVQVLDEDGHFHGRLEPAEAAVAFANALSESGSGHNLRTPLPELKEIVLRLATSAVERRAKLAKLQARCKQKKEQERRLLCQVQEHATKEAERKEKLRSPADHVASQLASKLASAKAARSAAVNELQKMQADAPAEFTSMREVVRFCNIILGIQVSHSSIARWARADKVLAPGRPPVMDDKAEPKQAAGTATGPKALDAWAASLHDPKQDIIERRDDEARGSIKENLAERRNNETADFAALQAHALKRANAAIRECDAEFDLLRARLEIKLRARQEIELDRLRARHEIELAKVKAEKDREIAELERLPDRVKRQRKLEHAYLNLVELRLKKIEAPADPRLPQAKEDKLLVIKAALLLEDLCRDKRDRFGNLLGVDGKRV